MTGLEASLVFAVGLVVGVLGACAGAAVAAARSRPHSAARSVDPYRVRPPAGGDAVRLRVVDGGAA